MAVVWAAVCAAGRVRARDAARAASRAAVSTCPAAVVVRPAASTSSSTASSAGVSTTSSSAAEPFSAARCRLRRSGGHGVAAWNCSIGPTASAVTCSGTPGSRDSAVPVTVTAALAGPRVAVTVTPVSRPGAGLGEERRGGGLPVGGAAAVQPDLAQPLDGGGLGEVPGVDEQPGLHGEQDQREQRGERDDQAERRRPGLPVPARGGEPRAAGPVVVRIVRRPS